MKSSNLWKESKDIYGEFLSDGRCSISNSLAETVFVPLLLEENSLFADTTKGAAASEASYSIIETAKQMVLAFLPIRIFTNAHANTDYYKIQDSLADLMPC